MYNDDLKENDQYGLFANRDFDENEIIQEYIGKNITNEESNNKKKNQLCTCLKLKLTEK